MNKKKEKLEQKIIPAKRKGHKKAIWRRVEMSCPICGKGISRMEDDVWGDDFICPDCNELMEVKK